MLPCYACNSKTIITLLYNQDRSFLNAVVVNYTPESQYSWLGSILEAYLCIMAALGVVVWDAYHDCCTIESALFWQRFFIFVWKHQRFLLFIVGVPRHIISIKVLNLWDCKIIEKLHRLFSLLDFNMNLKLMKNWMIEYNYNHL